MSFNLTEENKSALLKLARFTIASALGIDIGYIKENISFADKIFIEKTGAFVTIHKKGELRGCIGYIKGYKPLVETIEEMASSAAFRDPRFNPLTANEYADIDLEISVLSPIEKVHSIDDIVVGRDGLIISSGYSSGLLLPQVATEYNWTREEFLSNTCRKAGLPVNAWKEKDVVIEKFSAVVFGEKRSAHGC
jgi:AmmeMemoRadiSam system protein A